MSPTLRFITGPRAGEVVSLDQPRALIGRGENVDVVVDDPKASRTHAVIEADGERMDAAGAWRISDLGSRNGTLLNGDRVIAGARLHAGDRIRIGQIELEFERATAAAGARLRPLSGGADLRIGSVGVILGSSGLSVAPDCAPMHGEIVLQAGAWMLRPGPDGIAVNGQRQHRERRLRQGDRLTLASANLGFIDGRCADLDGEVVAGQVLDTLIGAGTLGMVYRAKTGDGTAAAAISAVKLLDPGLIERAGEVGRFLGAARAQQRISHPRVAAVLAIGHLDDLPAVVLVWQPGGTLASRLRKGPLAVMPTITLLYQVAVGLQAAATAGVVHQGLRPANIFFAADGGAVVADFGLCAPFDPAQPGDGGAPGWISPEEAGGSPADALANQFSLGLIAWHCLNGQPPFLAEDPVVCAAARLGSLAPPVSGLPPAFHAFLARLLARRPQHRFADWGEVVTVCTALATGQNPTIALPGATLLKEAGTGQPGHPPESGDDPEATRLGPAGAPERSGITGPEVGRMASDRSGPLPEHRVETSRTERRPPTFAPMADRLGPSPQATVPMMSRRPTRPTTEYIRRPPSSQPDDGSPGSGVSIGMVAGLVMTVALLIACSLFVLFVHFVFYGTWVASAGARGGAQGPVANPPAVTGTATALSHGDGSHGNGSASAAASLPVARAAAVVGTVPAVVPAVAASAVGSGLGTH